MKHPGPWTFESNVIRASDGTVVADDCNCVDTCDDDGNVIASSDEAQRLILAAPELLELLVEFKVRVSCDCIRGDGEQFVSRVDALLSRIEKGR